ncbi:ABC transporter substrate-binding protein [Ruania alba]|uniref:ABC transporter substrate-binding protein n=1 Tax=Ruania alba TaxID=648782 RepID=UPI0015872823|nr:ABC transporter substrate-binding protein [Ruania alba]
MVRPWRSQTALPTVCVAMVALMLAACGGPSLPNTVIAGTTATIGWSEQMTSTNVASTSGNTAGNHDVSALTRAQFAESVEGVVQIDESFGTVTITEPEGFTVAYDLAEPQWSDGIPVDAADLLLAWAAGSNALAPEDFDPAAATTEDGTLEVPGDTAWFDSVPTGLAASAEVPDYDEFARSIEVTYPEPVTDWQTALNVAVPAHVVGQLAFGIEDPMEAKQAVISAIVDEEQSAVAAISRAWNTGFDLGDGDGSSIPAELLLSSGPFRVEQVDQSRPDAQRVRLVVNPEYTGTPTPEYETLELRQTTVSDPLNSIGETLDVVQVAPTAPNRETTEQMERNDYSVATAHDGTYWVLILRNDRGEFAWHSAREAFLRAVQQRDVAEAGAGPWAGAQESTSVLLFPPSTDGYQIAVEDAGFEQAFARSEQEAIADREAAGVDDGARVCVLFDTDEPFAENAYRALRAGVREAGWEVRNCGTDDVAAARGNDNWHAVLTRVPVPETPADIAAQWGTDGIANWSGTAEPERDEMIAQLAHLPDRYEARDHRVVIESSIVDEAIAMPLAMNIRVTVSDRDIEVPPPRAGAVAPLTSGVVDWVVAQE